MSVTAAAKSRPRASRTAPCALERRPQAPHLVQQHRMASLLFRQPSQRFATNARIFMMARPHHECHDEAGYTTANVSNRLELAFVSATCGRMTTTIPRFRSAARMFLFSQLRSSLSGRFSFGTRRLFLQNRSAQGERQPFLLKQQKRPCAHAPEIGGWSSRDRPLCSS